MTVFGSATSEPVLVHQINRRNSIIDDESFYRILSHLAKLERDQQVHFDADEDILAQGATHAFLAELAQYSKYHAAEIAEVASKQSPAMSRIGAADAVRLKHNMASNSQVRPLHTGDHSTPLLNADGEAVLGNGTDQMQRSMLQLRRLCILQAHFQDLHGLDICGTGKTAAVMTQFQKRGWTRTQATDGRIWFLAPDAAVPAVVRTFHAVANNRVRPQDAQYLQALRAANFGDLLTDRAGHPRYGTAADQRRIDRGEDNAHDDAPPTSAAATDVSLDAIAAQTSTADFNLTVSTEGSRAADSGVLSTEDTSARWDRSRQKAVKKGRPELRQKGDPMPFKDGGKGKKRRPRSKLHMGRITKATNTVRPLNTAAGKGFSIAGESKFVEAGRPKKELRSSLCVAIRMS